MLAVLVSQAARGQTPAPQAAVALGAGAGHGIEEVIVTASKRSEKLQRVPMSVQVLDSKRLSQLQVHEFQDFLKFLPSVSAQTAGPNQTTINMRGVASGFEGNHSGPLPTVGTYLDELPITTIGGTLDVHLYDIARVEALPGPQVRCSVPAPRRERCASSRIPRPAPVFRAATTWKAMWWGTAASAALPKGS